ncbi:hypothetical protein GSQ51_17890 [Clostridioides difficile]|nr:hypothetical protein [Clostridioides difficile]NJK15960.1 hypothetical protein [Clostridioides difficile]
MKRDITKNQKKMIREDFQENSAISVDLYGKLYFGVSSFYYTVYIAHAKDFNNPEEMEKSIQKELDKIMKLHNMIEYI